MDGKIGFEEHSPSTIRSKAPRGVVQCGRHQRAGSAQDRSHNALKLFRLPH